MKEYLKMDDVFDLPIKESEIMWMVAHDSPERLECAVHAINSHNELVENMMHYKQEAERWEGIATKEASMVREFDLEVERLRADNERLKELNQQASHMIDILSNAEHGKVYGFIK